jgi:GTP cyclohydrolase I
MDEKAVEQMRATLETLGLDAEVDPELAETPRRFVELLAELFDRVDEPPPRPSVFPRDGDGRAEPVLLGALPFYSMCVHHLVPFVGTVDVAYLPDEHLVGFGSVGRVIEHFARRPQMQERLGEQIAAHLDESLAPRGVLVRVRARQFCMEMRGARKRGVLTSIASRGELAEGPLRAEILAQFAREERAP